MKKYESIFLSGCAYALLIVALFFAFAAMTGFTEARIGVSQFFIILLFGQIISVAGYILKNASWHIAARYALHYLTHFLAFTVVFIFNGQIKANGGAAIFSAAVIFTFLYAVTFLIIFAVKKSLSSVEKKMPKKSAKKDDNTKKANNTYTPRFK